MEWLVTVTSNGCRINDLIPRLNEELMLNAWIWILGIQLTFVSFFIMETRFLKGAGITIKEFQRNMKNRTEREHLYSLSQHRPSWKKHSQWVGRTRHYRQQCMDRRQRHHSPRSHHRRQRDYQCWIGRDQRYSIQCGGCRQSLLCHQRIVMNIISWFFRRSCSKLQIQLKDTIFTHINRNLKVVYGIPKIDIKWLWEDIFFYLWFRRKDISFWKI